MVTTKAYDDLVERLRREREVKANIHMELGFIDLTKPQERKALIERAQPKKRGRKSGSKNKPKEIK